MQYSVFYTVSFIIWKRDEICLQFNIWGAALFWLKSDSDEAKPSPMLLLQIIFYMQLPSSLTHLFYLSWPIIHLHLTFSRLCLQKRVWTCRYGSQKVYKNYVLRCDTLWSSGYHPSYRNMLPLLNVLLQFFFYLALGISLSHFSTNVALLSYTFLWFILHFGGFFCCTRHCLFHTLLVHAAFLIHTSTSVVRKRSYANMSYSHVLKPFSALTTMHYILWRMV